MQEVVTVYFLLICCKYIFVEYIEWLVENIEFNFTQAPSWVHNLYCSLCLGVGPSSMKQ